MTRKRLPLAERFWAHVDKSGDCWEWQGARTRQGYGRFQMGRGIGTRTATSVAYELSIGPVGDAWLLHRCDNPPCVRPDHLFLGTGADNNRDMAEKGRAWWQRPLTHCRYGHPYTPENLYIDTSGRSRCRTCRRARRRAKKELTGAWS